MDKLKHLDPKEPVRRYGHAVPGDFLHRDIKKPTGWPENHLQSQSEQQRHPWEFTHVCIDDKSRQANVHAMNDEKNKT